MRGTLREDAFWSGAVALEGTVVVPPGARLTLAPGTAVTATSGGERDVVRPMLGGQAELAPAGRAALVVLGELMVRGETDAPRATLGGPAWGGLAVMGRGRVRIERARIAAHRGYALRCADFADVRARDCGLEEGGALAGAFARLRLRDGSIADAENGVRLGDDAAARVTRTSFSGCARAARVEGCATLWLRGCRVERCGLGVELLGGARGSLRRCSLDAGATGVWAQNGALARLVETRLTGGDLGLRASHGGRAEARGCGFSGHRKCGLFVEERASARVEDCAFVGGLSSVIALGRSRVEALACRFAGSTDVALWLSRRARAAERACLFEDNAQDRRVVE